MIFHSFKKYFSFVIQIRGHIPLCASEKNTKIQDQKNYLNYWLFVRRIRVEKIKGEDNILLFDVLL